MNDLNKHLRQTKFRSIIGFGLILLFVGEGLIYAIYGKNAAVAGLICIGAGVVPVVIIYGMLALMEMVVKRSNRQ